MLNEGRTRKVIVSAVDGTHHEVTRALAPRVSHGSHHLRLTRARTHVQCDGTDVIGGDWSLAPLVRHSAAPQ